MLKQLFDYTDGRVKLWVYAVTAVGFILILFIIALSFLVWYVPYCFLTRFLAVHFAIFKNKSSIVGDTYCRWEQTEHGEEAKQIPEMNLVKYEMYASQYFLCRVLLLSDNGVRCSYLFFISVCHPRPQRRPLLPRRSPWPWPMMVTWICNQTVIPRKDALSLRQTTDCLQIVSKHVHHIRWVWWPSAVLPVVLQKCSAHDLLLKGNGAQDFGCSQLSSSKKRNQSWTQWKWDNRSLDIGNKLTLLLAMWTHSWSTVFNPKTMRTPKRQRQSGSTGDDYWSFCVSRIRRTIWLFVSYLCREGGKTSRVSSDLRHSKAEQQNIWLCLISAGFVWKEMSQAFWVKKTAFFSLNCE